MLLGASARSDMGRIRLNLETSKGKEGQGVSFGSGGYPRRPSTARSEAL